MFSPKLYKVYKFEFLDIINNNFNMSGDLSYYIIKQQDNQLFRLIRNYTNNFSDFNKYCVFVSCKGYNSNQELFNKMIIDGFYINGIHFVISERSASMTRQQIISFIDENIYDYISEAVGLGYDVKKTVLSKYVAYRGLMFSSCHCIDGWIPTFIVVDDYYTKIFNQKIRYVDDEYVELRNENGEKFNYKQKCIKDGFKDIEINAFDGCGIHHPSISKDIEFFLNSKTKISSVQWRLPFIKGVTHEIDYVKFFEDNGIEYIKDIWGVEHNIHQSMVILTKSMYKGYKEFKIYNDLRDWETYWDRFIKYKHCIGIAKWNFTKDEEPIYTRGNYQILQDLNIEFDNFMKLTDYSVDWIHKIIEDDIFYTYCFLGLFYDMHNPMNDYVKAIIKNKEMMKEKSVKEYITSLLRKYIDEMKCGKFWLKSTFKILTPDLIALMEHIGGLPVKGCLNDDEFYTNGKYKYENKEYLIERNPHICKSEHVILKNTENKIINEYISNLSNIVMVNIKSITPQRLNGAD